MANQPTLVGSRYELVERVAEGGMAIVWKARMRGAAGFSRLVAIKEIKIEYRTVRQYIQMFIEEARIGTELMHPNIVQVVDFVAEGDTHYLVLEWVDGVDFHGFVRAFSLLGQPIPWSLAAVACMGALQGLAAAHERRAPNGVASPVIHRDVSPHNILLSASGIAKLSDFGLARARDRAFTVTAPGMVKGKLGYFAPEITLGSTASVASDQFSMGCVLWEALACARLFDGESEIEVFQQIRSGQIKSLRDQRPDVPERVAQAVHRALMPTPEQRFPSARAFAAELGECIRELGGGLYDATERLATAVSVARQTLAELDPQTRISASQMNVATVSLQIDVNSAHFGGPTLAMKSQDQGDSD